MSIFDPERPELRIRIPSRRRSLDDAARLERDTLLILREVFPDAREWIVTGEPRKPAAITVDDTNSFVQTIINLRRVRPGGKFLDPESKFYTPESVPFLYTVMNCFYTPNPVNPSRPNPKPEESWGVDFYLGFSETSYERINVNFPFDVVKSSEGVAKIERLLERLVERMNPEDARFAIVNFDKPFWEVAHRIGWLTYFSQRSLVEYLRDDPRARPFHRGLILKLSDDPRDMMKTDFVDESFAFAQTLVPHWPPQLN